MHKRLVMVSAYPGVLFAIRERIVMKTKFTFRTIAKILKMKKKNVCTLKRTTLGERNLKPYFHLKVCSKTHCRNGEFLYSHFKFCLSIDLVCDGINHCFMNEDEYFCGIH